MDVTFHYNQGIKFFRQGLLQKSEASFRSAIELDPKHLHAHQQLGLLLSKMLRFEEAEKHFQLVCGAEPENTRAHNTLGEILSVLGRKSDAISVFKKVLDIDPNFLEAKVALVNYNQMGTNQKRNCKKMTILVSELKNFSSLPKNTCWS